jgi:DegV family protein with EDD domain
MDKLTVKPRRLLEISADESTLPTSSQPSPKQVENVLDYLSTYYDSAIIMTVSKELSGTYNTFAKAAEKFTKKDFQISVINSKQNSGAQGLLVKACAELIMEGKSHEDIVKAISKQTERSKILVQVKTLDNMIKSGRLSVRAGKIAKAIGMKPIVTLDEEGKGALDAIAFSERGSNNKIIKHISKVTRNHRIKAYSIVHVNNPEGAETMRKQLVGLVGKEPDYICETSSIVAVGAGNGAVGISYLLE